MEWTWDPAKAEANQRKHRIRFEVAAIALDHPLVDSHQDWHPDGDRVRTFAPAGPLLLLIVHTLPNGKPGRIFGSREATPRERRYYETRT